MVTKYDKGSKGEGESVYFGSEERGRESQYYCVGCLSSGFDMCLYAKYFTFLGIRVPSPFNKNLLWIT